MKRILALLCIMAPAAAIVACKGDVLRVGQSPSDAGSPPSSDAGSPPSDGPPSDAGSSGAVEVWTGYLENFKFASGSDKVTLTFTEDDETALTGTAFFGEPPALPPPTDPDIGYPPIDSGFIPDPLRHLPVLPIDRFAFTVLHGSRRAERIQFDVVIDEIEKQWCELQTTIYEVDPSPGVVEYRCTPNAVWGRGNCDGGPGPPDTCALGSGPDCHEVDCEKLALCQSLNSPCQCTQTKCTVDLTRPSMGGLHADMQVTGNAANGSIAGLSGFVNVHLHRQ